MDGKEFLKKSFKAVMREDWEKATNELKSDKGNLTVLTALLMANNRDTVLHLAVQSGEEEPTKTFLEAMTEIDHPNWQNKVGNTPLHEAASVGNLAAVKLLVEFRKSDMLEKNMYGETPLYRAAKYGKLPVVEYFLDECEDKDSRSSLNWSSNDTPIIHAAILSENFEVVLKLLDFEKSLLEMVTADGRTALHALAQMPHVFKSGCSMSYLESTVYDWLPDKNIYDDIGNFECSDNNHSKSSSSKKDDDLEAERSHKWRGSNWWWPECQKMYKMKQDHSLALIIVRKLVDVEQSWFQFTKERAMNEDPVLLGDEPEPILLRRSEPSKKFENEERAKKEDVDSMVHSHKQPKDVQEEMDKKFQSIGDQETPLLLAVANGIIEVVAEILEQQPVAVDYVTSTQMNIMHVIIAHRQLHIFKWFEKRKQLMCRLVERIDARGFTLLHRVGDITFLPQATSGPALQLQEELKWFDRVVNVVPPHYAQRQNKVQLQKPRDYFDEKHTPMLENAKEWLKKTAEACSAVAVLVATVVFAAVITVPGGLNSKTGTPILLDKPVYMAFTIMDIIGLTTSLASVVLFLSILMSPFTMDDFKHRLPLKLSIAFQLLFISVASTMMAFAFAVVLIMKSTHVKWATIFLYMASFFPIGVFMIIHLHLFGQLAKNLCSQHLTLLKFLPSGFVTSFLKLPDKLFKKKSA